MINLPDVQRVNTSRPDFEDTDPVSFYNHLMPDEPLKILQRKYWTLTKKHILVNNDAQLNFDGQNYICQSSGAEFRKGVTYTPFQVLVKAIFSGNFQACINWINYEYRSSDLPYVRIGCDYFKNIQKRDRNGIVTTELKTWKKDELKQDLGPAMLRNIPCFDDFCMVPDNFNYEPTIENCYNVYSYFAHKPEPGDITWSQRIMEHVFGDQINLGYRYLQALYLHPDHMLPVLVLVSKERSTGKTTFLNWLNMIFGNNMVMISPDDLVNSFNATISKSNIIAIEETLIEKSMTVEKIKALSTGKWITVNRKFVDQYKLPFFGKIIMVSNQEDKFARIDQDEIRFFVRKLNYPQFTNHNIEEDLKTEIPAFLHYLKELPAIDWSVSRNGFTPAELNNESLQKVKSESRTWMHKELITYFVSIFENNPEIDMFYCHPADVKQKYWPNAKDVTMHFIESTMRDGMNLKKSAVKYYRPFEESHQLMKTARPFIIEAKDFEISRIDENRQIQVDF